MLFNSIKAVYSVGSVLACLSTTTLFVSPATIVTAAVVGSAAYLVSSTKDK